MLLFKRDVFVFYEVREKMRMEDINTWMSYEFSIRDDDDDEDDDWEEWDDEEEEE